MISLQKRLRMGYAQLVNTTIIKDYNFEDFILVEKINEDDRSVAIYFATFDSDRKKPQGLWNLRYIVDWRTFKKAFKKVTGYDYPKKWNNLQWCYKLI